MSEWEPTTQPWIVSAANQLPNGVLLVGPRHWDTTMRKQFKAMYGDDAFTNPDKRVPHGDIEQGFIDQWGRFYTREEAMVVARQNDQIIVPDEQMLSLSALHSEDLY